MVDTSTEAVTKLLDGVTPGPWGAEYDDYGEEIWFGGEGCGTWTVGPCFIGGDGHDPDLARIMDADARFIAAARDLVPALLAERDALKALADALNDKLEIERALTDGAHRRARTADAKVDRLKAQPVTVQEAALVPEVQALIEASYENGLSDALGIVASIGYGATEDVDRGHEDAYRAIEKHLADWKASAAAMRAIAEGRE